MTRRIHFAVPRAGGGELVHTDRKVLGSWKEIAAYLDKGVRTVQRWETDLGLPVRRPNGAAKGVVYATPDDLDRWLTQQWVRRGNPKLTGEARELSRALEASDYLRNANQKLVEELTASLQSLRETCAALVNAAKVAQGARERVRASRAKLEETMKRSHKARTHRK